MARKPKMPTNTDFVKRYMEYGSPLRQAFLMDCVSKIADAIMENQDTFRKEMHGHFIHADAWIACARDWREEYEEYFHNNINTKTVSL